LVIFYYQKTGKRQQSVLSGKDKDWLKQLWPRLHTRQTAQRNGVLKGPSVLRVYRPFAAAFWIGWLSQSYFQE
jgi:hypothetical protein